MPNYTKLFNTIISSTIWSENDKTRIVWITMLAIADQNGEVQGSIPGLARLAGVSIEDTEIAIDKFLSPDPYSQTPDYEGRRICKIDGGWELLNHAKYRRMASLADNKDTNAKRQKRHRERNNEVTHERYSNASVTHRNATVTLQTDKAEAEAEAEELELSKTKSNKARIVMYRPSIDAVRVFARELGLPESDGEYMFHHWESNGWTKNGKPIKNWQAMIRSWKSAKYMPSQKTNARLSGGTQSTYADRNPKDSGETYEIPEA